MDDLGDLVDKLMALRNEAASTGDRMSSNYPVTGREDAQYYFGLKDGLGTAIVLVTELMQREVTAPQTCETA